MTPDQRARLRARMTSLLAQGARVDRGDDRPKDRELKLLVAALTAGNHRSAGRRHGRAVKGHRGSLASTPAASPQVLGRQMTMTQHHLPG